ELRFEPFEFSGDDLRDRVLRYQEERSALLRSGWCCAEGIRVSQTGCHVGDLHTRRELGGDASSCSVTVGTGEPLRAHDAGRGRNLDGRILDAARGDVDRLAATGTAEQAGQRVPLCAVDGEAPPVFDLH